jgi:hypothetical protein
VRGKHDFDRLKVPFPWFGGKQHAAPHIWSALGDVPHYVEPFAGSIATLLRRPHKANRSYYSETINDLDGFLVNFWRSIQHSPDATAEAASWPVSEADLHARHIWLLKWRDGAVDHLSGDPTWHDPQAAGYWAWGQSCWIGSGWCSGKGPWWAGDDGILYRRARGAGVNRKRPHIGDNGQGVNTAAMREEGVSRQLPHLGNDGQGVNRPQLREEGVGDYHPMTMPELRRWFAFLAARLRHVRILHGDWSRAVTSGATQTLRVRQGKGPVGVFLDPPYSLDVRAECYSVDSGTVAAEVREWCREHGPDPRYRIVLAGFAGEGHEDLGWREVEWFAKGFLRGGMGNTGKNGHQQKRERLWLSPHCLTVEATEPVVMPDGDRRQLSLFEAAQ